MEELLQLLGHLTPGELFADPRSAPSNAYLGLAAIFGLLFIGGVVSSRFAVRLSKGNRIHQRLFDLYGQWFAWLGFAGLIIVLLRYSNVQMMSKRIWTILDIAAIIGVAIYFAQYRIRRYPAQLADYLEAERKKRYLPGRRRR